jgi:hypothetical protein
MSKPIAAVMRARDRLHTKVWEKSSSPVQMSTASQIARVKIVRNQSQDQQQQADQQQPTTTLQPDLHQDLHLSLTPIASTLEIGVTTNSKTKTLGRPFPKVMLIGVRLQQRATNPQLLISSKTILHLTDVALLVQDLDLLLSQKQPPVLQQRRTTPPLDLALQPDLFLKETGAKVTLLPTRARVDAKHIATTNSAQWRRTSAGDIMVMLVVNSSSASVERMVRRTDQLCCQDANAIAKMDAKNRLYCFCNTTTHDILDESRSVCTSPNIIFKY